MSSSSEYILKSKQLLQAKKMDCNKLKSYKGLERLSDEEANNMIEQLERLATILYKQVLHEQIK